MIGLLFAGPVPDCATAAEECALARHGFVVERGIGMLPGAVDTRLLPEGFPAAKGWVRIIATPPLAPNPACSFRSGSLHDSASGSGHLPCPWADDGPLRAASRFAKRLLEAGGTAVVLERAGGLALEAESFLHRLGDVEDETSHPFLAWLDFGVEQTPSGAIVFRTHGMDVAGLPDVEVALEDKSQTGMRRAGDAALFACLLQTKANRPLAAGERVRVPADVEFSFRGALTRGETFHEFIANGGVPITLSPAGATKRTKQA